MNTTKIKDIVKQNNGIITARQAAASNVDSWYLTNMVKKGELERVARGVYIDAHYGNYDELHFFQLKNKSCVYSYQTALYLHGLTDRMPFINEITVKQGYNCWRIKDRVVAHQVKKEWFTLGITRVKTPMGNYVQAYDMERTMCDLVRDRKQQDAEIFAKAWQLYLSKGDKDIWNLRKYAKTLGVAQRVEEILEVLAHE
jgi:hypothetical protein